jgi:hypothetical protein
MEPKEYEMVTEKFYRANIICGNCQFSGKIAIAKGTKIVEQFCPNCYCYCLSRLPKTAYELEPFLMIVIRLNTKCY